MRTNSIRDITFYDFLIKADPGHAPDKSMTYFIQRLEQLYNSNGTERWNRNRTQKIFIRGLEIDRTRGHVTILIYHTDGNASGASYAHLDNNNQRNETPLPREGRPESAHLLLTLTSSSQGEQRFLGLLEESTKINRVTVQSYLNFLFRKIKSENPADFVAPRPDGSLKRDGTPQTYPYRSKFEISGHPSDEFMNMLREGKLSGIALETNRADQFAFGDGTLVSASKKELRLTPVAGKWHERGVDRFNEAIRLGRERNYENARITFQAPDGKSHTARIDTASGNTYADQFIKRQRLTGFTRFLHDADEAINDEMRSKMLAAGGLV